MASFIQVGSTHFEQKFPLTLYRSTVSGAKVVIVDHPSPIIKAHISFSTLHEDDSGLAYSILCLISHGSKNYPYSAFLKNLAEKSYGSTDSAMALGNTVFEIKIIESEGFFKLLPIYLDHIFNPLLTESAYITEVHHINGEGQDGGFVYSEMKVEKIREFSKLKALTLGENSPFSKRIGGNPKDIRETCNLERIKAYHKKFYRMENMIISIVGTVPHQKVLEAVEEFQNSNGFVKKDDFVRPFEDYIPPPLTGITVERMKIPNFDELKYLAFREVEKCKKVLTYGEEYWKQLVDKYLNENYVVLYAIPSRTLIEKEKMEEDERLKKQVEELGPEGLKRCGEILERAVAANKASEASAEVLDKYAKLTELQKELSKVQVNLHVIGNPEGINRLDFNSWPKLSGENVMLYNLEKFKDYSKGAGKTYCICITKCTFGLMNQFVKAPLDIKSPELTYSMLLNVYFGERDGIANYKVRRERFANYVEFSIIRDLGLLLKIRYAKNLPKAYEIVKKCVCETIESEKLHLELFERAKRSLIMKCVNEESTIKRAAEMSYVDHMKKFNFDENQAQMRIAHIKEATPEKVLQSVGSFYLDLFDDSKCGKAIVVPITERKNIKEAFPNVEFKPRRYL